MKIRRTSLKTKKTLKIKRLEEDGSDPKSSPVQKLSKISDDYPAQKSNSNEIEGKQPLDDPSAAPGEYMLFHFPSEPSLQVPGPIPKKFGFIGLGMMGQMIMKHMLNLEQDVSIWNRNAEEGLIFVEAGAQLRSTPSEVVRNSDIIFSCVSGSDFVKSHLYHDEGVLQGFKKSETGTKGYVELTGIDPSTSIESAEAINYFGGRYLKAPIFHPERFEENGRLEILCSGDMGLFKECESWFTAFTEDVSFSSCDVGEDTEFLLLFNRVKNVDEKILDVFRVFNQNN
ncbi:putative oxidoreductase GLYR1 homolog [Trichonephila inaurata madagascariensis]|uniref:Putative oxidoreductase GLYR1 homolog n=1 Tax=Trichonephila inaurata madagascariensis TaxID=2747483 RepID=A0A8X6WZ91_9ARAC|nr:putative oxidoreductase GLYR1 homolog [Trichonephila inaurata madagascariensis]